MSFDPFKRLTVLNRKALLGASFLKAVMSGQTRPFLIGWCITNQCNLKCVYCHSGQKSIPELSTNQIKEIILLLFKRGTRVIRFTGGEPLLRPDLEELISLNNKLGIWTTVATNGVLVPSHIRTLKLVDNVVISIDGPEDVHDALRGAGSYRKAVEACDALFEEKIPISISTVLTSLNSQSIESVLALAARFKAKAFFQPATSSVLFGDPSNPVFPADHEYPRVLHRLLELKKRNKAVGNSREAIKYFLGARYHKINCVAGKIFFRIEPQGDIHTCLRAEIAPDRLNLLKHGLDHCLKQIGSRPCDDCWSINLIEMNLLASGRLGAVIDGVKSFL
jgi:MoaA/NifB/PqqE/SkfB family radical SAM enzyme